MAKGEDEKPRDRSKKAKAFDTRAVHAASPPDYNAGAVVAPIYQTTTFHFPAELSEARNHGEVHLYTRLRNPTTSQAAQAISELEGAETGRVFASGMGALSCAVLSLLGTGDEIVALEDLYGNTITMLRHLLPQWGIRVRWVPQGASSTVADLVSDSTRLLLMESPTNPTLRVHDVRAWAAAARKAGALLLVDNTFATPVNQNPLDLGADLVMHSATKYLSGHSDVIAGALVGRTEPMERATRWADTLGATLDPMAAFLLIRGIKTVGVRVRRQNETARILVETFSEDPRIEQVLYPGRHSAEEERLASVQMRGRGGMVSLSLRGGRSSARNFLAGLKLIHPASSLGGVESLASLPVETSHRHLTPEERHARGIDDGLVRISVGLEDPDDLADDIRQALSSL